MKEETFISIFFVNVSPSFVVKKKKKEEKQWEDDGEGGRKMKKAKEI